MGNVPAAAGATHGNDMWRLLLPGNTTYRGPAVLASANAVCDGLSVISNWGRRRVILRLRRQRTGIDNAEAAVWRFNDSSDIDATVPADQEIGGFQAKTIALQSLGIGCAEYDLRGRI